ncbi:hypothetical protein CYMTET_3631 [Cymbomonas tetramitiformis]|uniref:Uncharacterized protein n=1 Tax=Cymbomonas tetramitiformis TaxID=36881 RepID=A0AAE0H2X4_9CHLO|nr:hypothetical protein CYMTET_3631 [Cymbomonas tetramitiformis]
MDDPTLVVHRSVNELVYDTLGYIVEPDSVAYGYLLGTDAVSDRVGRRALVDLINKGCVPPAIRQKPVGDDLVIKLLTKLRGSRTSSSPNANESAADNGPAAFSAACARYGAPAVLNDGASAGGVYISAYGFATGDSEDYDDEGMDVEAELQQLRSEVTTATGVSMVQASFAPPVSAVVAATAANDAPSFSYSAPTDEFVGGIAMLPPPAGPRTIEVGACSLGDLPVDAVEPVGIQLPCTVVAALRLHLAREPVVCYGQACIYNGIGTLSPVVRAQVLATFQAAALSGGADIASGGAPGGAPGGGPVIASGTIAAG